ncbi:MAG TPA: nucleoside hydrolase [Thermoguttaceae bacterium]|nr:nucleoside hydrolase [Thermoguttaceae bacterium]
MGVATSAVVISLVALGACGDASPPSHGTIPVLYSTDLHHPHQDPDDHFDLATLFALPEFDVRGILLDCGARQLAQPGKIPVEQMAHLTGRDVRHAIGLESPLRSPADDGRDQPARCQKGVALILDVLRQADEKVTIFTTGSLRDVAAALNREPELFRHKVRRLYVNIGDSGAAGGGQEYNVKLDTASYVRVLRSGLPVYWCPCFDGGVWKRQRGYATYWRFVHEEVLETAPQRLQNWFIFALVKPDADPIAFLSRAQEPAVRRRVWSMPRNMWCTAPFLHAAGRDVVEPSTGRWVARPADRESQNVTTPYAFVPARVTVDDKARATLHLDETAQGEAVHVFKILDQANYDKIMASCLRELLAGLRIADR